tara:strand:- start:1241 stop:2935 length:1695 start_codon:yes stop_codon:yes gene_type:complete
MSMDEEPIYKSFTRRRRRRQPYEFADSSDEEEEKEPKRAKAAPGLAPAQAPDQAQPQQQALGTANLFGDYLNVSYLRGIIIALNNGNLDIIMENGKVIRGISKDSKLLDIDKEIINEGVFIGHDIGVSPDLAANAMDLDDSNSDSEDGVLITQSPPPPPDAPAASLRASSPPTGARQAECNPTRSNYCIIKILSCDYHHSKPIVDISKALQPKSQEEIDKGKNGVGGEIKNNLSMMTASATDKLKNETFYFRELQENKNITRYYEYYIVLNDGVDPWCYGPVSEYIIKNGIQVNIIENIVDQRYDNTTGGIPRLSVMEDFFPHGRPWNNMIIQPNPKLLEQWWENSEGMLQSIIDSHSYKFKIPDLQVDFNYKEYYETCYAPGPQEEQISYINYYDLLPLLIKFKGLMGTKTPPYNKLYNEFYSKDEDDKKYREDRFLLDLEEDIPVPLASESFQNISNLDKLLKDIYGYEVDLVDLRSSNLAKNLSSATDEIQHFNKYYINNNLSKGRPGNKFLDDMIYEDHEFSPTANYFNLTKNPNACICYGSHIIPYGNKGKKKKNGPKR